MPIPSKLFFDKTHKKSVYNIQSISNIPSVIRHGLLSYNRAATMKHASIAMSDVQSRRNDVIIPNGGPLHSYANAYFDPQSNDVQATKYRRITMRAGHFSIRARF